MSASTIDPKALLELAQEACLAARDTLSGSQSPESAVLSAVGRDIKLQADRDAEEAIIRVLSRSEFPVLAEEGGATGDVLRGGPVWVVDPLDGTMNFSRGIPLYSTAIGLLVNQEPVLGVIHDVTRDETFAGADGLGCWCNGLPTSVSRETAPSRSILATGLPTGRDYSTESLAALVGEFQRFKKIRMLGSAALMLAYVAAGRVDAYAEDDIMLWDVAAGVALVKAAGGFASMEPSARHTWGRRVRCAGQPALWTD